MEKIKIIYEDEDLIAVDKPKGIPSQPTVDPKRENLFDLLKEQCNSKNIFLHHRLDKDTSGVMLFSKSKRVNPHLTKMFQNHLFEKKYECVTRAKSDAACGLIQSQWEVKNHLIARRKSSQQMKVFRTESGGQIAITNFKVLGHSNKDPQLQHIEAHPLTGRTHQIRVHLLNSQQPIVGDTLYGRKESNLSGFLLHAKILKFNHPLAPNRTVELSAEYPSQFISFLKIHFSNFSAFKE